LKKLHRETVDFVDEFKTFYNITSMPLILFEHIPLHKPRGSCTDAPRINYDKKGYVESQNMLSPESSEFLLEMKPSLIFNGHDHFGCTYQHPEPYNTREFTVPSIMGSFGGFTGVLQITQKEMETENVIEEGEGSDENAQEGFIESVYDYKVTLVRFFTTGEVFCILGLTGGWIVAVIQSWMCCSIRRRKPVLKVTPIKKTQ